MRAHRIVGSLGLALGLVVSYANAQPLRRVAALDPAIAPAPTEPTGAAPPTTQASPPPSVEPGAPPPATPAATAPQAAVTAPPAPHTALEPQVAPITFGLDARAKDSPGGRATSSVPIRSRRKLELLAECGWNSLAGFGATLTYNAHPHLAFDLGGGLSTTGWKAGVRGRYNLLTGAFTPFVGAGLSLSSGLDDTRISRDRNRDRNRDDFGSFDDFDPSRSGRYDVKRSEFAQAVLGFEFIHRHGFTMQAAAGYSWLLNKNNFTFVEGRRDDHLASALFGSGPVVSAAFGYAFD